MNSFKIIVSFLIVLVFEFHILAEERSKVPGTEYIPVETHLKVDVKSDTEKITFVTDNDDPDVVTKAYELKNASPWVIRGYILSSIGGEHGTLNNPGSGGKKINENHTKVEAIEYNDGKGVLIISAEDYKFKHQPSGALSIDELVKKLDVTGFTGSTGSSVIMYFPVARVALRLKHLLEQAGALSDNDVQETDVSGTTITVDTELNALIILTPRFKKKEILRMISEYDRPLPEANIKCTVYEVNIEDDTKVGNDFQAWKNGMGSDMFSAGINYSNGWTGSASNGFPSWNNSQNVKFIQFSPRWSTQYLDFLKTKGYAKVVTTGEIEVLNGLEGKITKSTFIPYYENGEQLSGSSISVGDLVAWSSTDNGGVGSAVPKITASYKVGVDKDGKIITAGADINAGEMTVSKIERGDSSLPALYSLRIISGDGYFARDGVAIGKTVDVYGYYESVILATGGSTPTTSWHANPVFEVSKGTKLKTSVLNYGYTLSIKPSICTDSTTLSIAITNESLLGYKSNGAPRIVESDIKTDVMVSNNGGMFVIGGVTNSSLVTSVNKVPYLGDIPLLGWFFKTNYKAVKQTQMIAVVECKLHHPGTPLSGGVLEAIGEVNGAIIERDR